MKKSLWAALCFSLLFLASTAAAKPAEYQADGSQVFWFVQISDLHVSTFLDANYGKRLTWALSEGLSTVKPSFVAATGDLTDSTDGFIYGKGPLLAEWKDYRGYLDKAGLDARFYFDIPGNHDAYGDGQLKFYLAHSLWGSTFHTTQPAWSIDFSHGRYLFLSAPTPANDGQQWPADNATLTVEENAGFDALAKTLGPSDFAMAFGHHPLAEVNQHEALLTLFDRYDIRYYACGHKHDHIFDTELSGVTQIRIDSLGQNPDHHFAVWALDGRALSHTAVGSDKPWPLIVVTAPAALWPVEADGEDDPKADVYAPAVPKSCTNAPLRVLVFDKQPVSGVRFSIDDGGWTPLVLRAYAPQQWRGTFDASTLSVGEHRLNVEADGTLTRGVVSLFRVEDMPCELGEEDPDEALEEGEITVPYAGDGDSDPDGDTVSDGDQAADGDVIPDGDADSDDDQFPDGDEEAVLPTDGDGVDDDVAPDGDASRHCANSERRCRDRLTPEECRNELWTALDSCTGGSRCKDGSCRMQTEDGDEESGSENAADGDRSGEEPEGASEAPGVSTDGCQGTGGEGADSVLMFFAFVGLAAILRKRSRAPRDMVI